ncbi:hypothetical protein CANARDRAFT_199912 [[Candida] arabinofermentans NRRL YB-2248]|uniref:N-acetyltransferase domain-containing protein n=1 Tax=[Candida] arabinofermentans NRRL YB-2248 TaxID=983967 RepID=A0A1E4SZM1_9ASCO|nr:hypothetical protein CANARDRAFT_199912 [[Candida] arabinofermentans NRRL YB-2248]
MSQEKATIRSIEKKDKEQWLDLFSGPKSYLAFRKTVVDPEILETTFDRFFNPNIPMNCFVAVDPKTEKLIGFGTYYTHYNILSVKLTTYLSDLFVASDCRLGGTGKALIQAVYDFADANDSDKVYWHTHFENHRAQLLYIKVAKKAGFLVYRRPTAGELPDYDSENHPIAPGS